MCGGKLLTTRTITLLPFTGKEKVLQQHLVLQLFFSVYKPFTKDSFVTFLSVIIFRDQSMSWQIFSHDVGISRTNKFCLILISFSTERTMALMSIADRLEFESDLCAVEAEVRAGVNEEYAEKKD